MLLLNPGYNQYVVDFGIEKKGGNWAVVNDGVMGGLSSSNAVLLDNSMLFKGEVSLENNGGFASIRSDRGSIDLSEYTFVSIRYKSSGQQTAIRLLPNEMYYQPYFKKLLEQTSGEWKTIVFSIFDFQEYALNRKLNSDLTMDKLKNIKRIGFIVNNKQSGEFEFEIDYLKFY